MYTPVRMISREMKTTLLTIYSYDEKTLNGSISNPFFKESLYFGNVMQFLLLMEQLFTSIGFPQRTMELRTAGESSLPEGSTPKAAGKNPLAVFELEVIFMQNASWQGSLVWQEKNLVYSFRSVLELLVLMDSILTSKTA